MSDIAVHVWYSLLPETLSPALVEHCMSLLSSGEKKSLKGLAHKQRRQEMLVSCALRRTAISNFLNNAPSDCNFGKSNKGRPFLSGAPKNFDFNLTHCQGYVALALSNDAQVGIDMEPYSRAHELEEIRKKFLTPSEAILIEVLPPDQKTRWLIELWTLKEAWAKALGDGLGVDLATLEFAFHEQGGRRVIHTMNHDWQFTMCTLSPEHATALAIRADGRKVSVEYNRAFGLSSF